MASQFKEPTIKVTQEVISSPSANVNDIGVVTAGCVVSDTGPLVPTLVSSQKELLNKYTLTGSLSSLDHPTLINAAELINSGPLLLVRSSNSIFTKAVTSQGIQIPYNVNTNTLMNYRANLSLVVNHTGDVPETKATATFFTLLYDLTAVGDTISFQVQDPLLGTYVFASYTRVSGDTTENIYVASVRTAINNSSSGYTASGTGSQLIITAKPGLGSSINGATIWYFQATVGMTYIRSTGFSGGVNQQLINTSNVYLTVGDYVLYKGVVPTVANKILVPWNGDFVTGLTYLKSRTIDIFFEYVSQSTVGSNTTYVYKLYSVDQITSVTSSVTSYVTSASLSGLVPSWYALNNSILKPGFAIVPRTFSLTDNISLSVAPVNNNNDRATITYDGSDYLISMLESDLNSFGQSIYLNYVNNLDVPFSLLVINPIGYDTPHVVSATYNIGRGISYTTAGSASSDNIILALQDLIDQEVELVDFVSDFNLNNVGVIPTLSMVALNNFAQLPLNSPSSLNNPTLIKNYKSNSGVIGDHIYWIANNDRTTSNGFVADIGAAIRYIQTVASNSLGNKEYAPAYSLETGLVSMSNPRLNFKLSDRNSLLESQINFITQDPVSKAWFINNNYTNKPTLDVWSEENNKRLSLRISRDVKILMKSFISKPNIQTTWATIEATINRYFEIYIDSQYWKLLKRTVICNSSNNDGSNNTVYVNIKAQYPNSIKEVDILNQGYPVNINW